MELETCSPLSVPPPHGTSLTVLDLDILLLILEQINLTDSEYGIKEQTPASSATFECQSNTYYQTHKTLPVLRLVSRDLNRLVTPIRYRMFKIKFSNLLNDISLRVIEDVKRFTRYAIFDQRVSWELVTMYYDSLPRLDTISWKFIAYSENSIDKTFTPIPFSILRPNVRISLQATGFFHEFTRFIPPESLISLKLGYWSTPFPSELQYQVPFKQYLVAATNLRSLTYEVADEKAGGPVLHLPKFLPNERMPALEELTLTSYKWYHTPEEAKKSWNFTKLRFLDIRGIDLSKFLSSIVFGDFVKLRVLQTGDLCWGVKEEKREKGTVLLVEFLRCLENLEELNITGRTFELLSYDVFENLGQLKRLEYREKTLKNGTNAKRSERKLGVERLRRLKGWCPLLQDLEIDMDLPRSEFPTYIETLGSFPCLKKVTLYTHLRESDWNTGMESRLINASYTLFEIASMGKISKLGIDLTINVGKFQRRTSNLWGEYLEWVTGRTFSKHWKKAGG